MAYLFGSSEGGFFVASVVSGEVYDPTFDAPVDAAFIWNVLPSFYRDLMDGKELFQTVWEGALREMAADYLNLWQVDYAKSLSTVPVLSQRKWTRFDFLQSDDFLSDTTTFSRHGIPGTFSGEYGYVACTLENRARHDRYVTPLKSTASQDASLKWSADIVVNSADKLGAAVVGYFDSSEARMRGSLSVGVMADETTPDTISALVIHTDATGKSTVALDAPLLSVGTEYRLSAEYTARTGVASLDITELNYSRMTGTGFTESNGLEVFTNVLQDASVNFDTSGVLVGDKLIAFNREFEIISVDGSQLTVTPTALHVDVSSISYEITGPQSISTISLDIPAESVDPTFTVDQFGIGSVDIAAFTTLFATFPSNARRRKIDLTVDAVTYLDPTSDVPILSAPRLQDSITDPAVLLYEGTDYTTDTYSVKFQEPPATAYWGEYVAYDEAHIERNFGSNVGLIAPSSDQYKAQVRGLYYSYFQGPTVDAIHTGVHILLGLPIADVAGTVDAINPTYSGDYGLIRVAGVDYLYPSVVGTPLQVGDDVSLFSRLSNGVEISDYINDPTWWTESESIHELKKYHSFRVALDLEVFSIEALTLASTFVSNIKPSWKDPYFMVFKNVIDEVEVADEVAINLLLNFYDTMCDTFIVAYDDAIYEGTPPDWAYDQGAAEWEVTTPGMREAAEVVSGTLTVTNGSTAVVGTSSAFLTDIGGPGAVTDKRLALAIHRTSTTGFTTAGSYLLEDPSADFLEAGREVVAGDIVEIIGYSPFVVAEVVDATTLRLGIPFATTSVNISYTVRGKHLIWAYVDTVTDDLNFDFATNATVATGEYLGAVVDNTRANVYYDRFDEMCPQEDVSFVAIVSATYAGGFPLAVTLPTSQTTTSTQNITAPLGSSGDRVSTTLAEPTP